ncbi:Uncharacterised protein [Streptococcus pneumoniae]|nr:Uncharacterised protein [Streptococcus pneumoniae]
MVDTSTVKDIVDFTHSISIDTSLIQFIQNSWGKWRYSQVTTVCRTSEVTWFTYIRASNDATKKGRTLKGNRTSVFTDTVQFIQRNNVFVGSNLQNRVS